MFLAIFFSFLLTQSASVSPEKTCGWSLFYYEFTREDYMKMSAAMKQQNFDTAKEIFAKQDNSLEASIKYNPGFYVTNMNGDSMNIPGEGYGVQTLCGFENSNKFKAQLYFGVMWKSLVGFEDFDTPSVLAISASDLEKNYYILMVVEGLVIGNTVEQNQLSSVIWRSCGTLNPVHVSIMAWRKGLTDTYSFFVIPYTIDSMYLPSTDEKQSSTDIELMHEFEGITYGPNLLQAVDAILNKHPQKNTYDWSESNKLWCEDPVNQESYFKPTDTLAHIDVTIEKAAQLYSTTSKVTIDLSQYDGIGTFQFAGSCENSYSGRTKDVGLAKKNKYRHFTLKENIVVSSVVEPCSGSLSQRPAAQTDDKIAWARCLDSPGPSGPSEPSFNCIDRPICTVQEAVDKILAIPKDAFENRASYLCCPSVDKRFRRFQFIRQTLCIHGVAPINYLLNNRESSVEYINRVETFEGFLRQKVLEMENEDRFFTIGSEHGMHRVNRWKFKPSEHFEQRWFTLAKDDGKKFFMDGYYDVANLVTCFPKHLFGSSVSGHISVVNKVEKTLNYMELNWPSESAPRDPTCVIPAAQEPLTCHGQVKFIEAESLCGSLELPFLDQSKLCCNLDLPCYDGYQPFWIRSSETMFFHMEHFTSPSSSFSVDLLWTRPFYEDTSPGSEVGMLDFYDLEGGNLKAGFVEVVSSKTPFVIEVKTKGTCNICKVSATFEVGTLSVTQDEEYPCGKIMGIFIEIASYQEIFISKQIQLKSEWKEFALMTTLNFYAPPSHSPPRMGLDDIPEEDWQRIISAEKPYVFVYSGMLCRVDTTCHLVLEYTGAATLVVNAAQVNLVPHNGLSCGFLDTNCAMHEGDSAMRSRSEALDRQKIQTQSVIKPGEDYEVRVTYGRNVDTVDSSYEFKVALLWRCDYDSSDPIERVIPRECWSNGFGYVRITAVSKTFDFSEESIPVEFYHHSDDVSEDSAISCSVVGQGVGNLVFSDCSSMISDQPKHLFMYIGWGTLDFEDIPHVGQVEVECKVSGMEEYSQTLFINPVDVFPNKYPKRCYVNHNLMLFSFNWFDKDIMTRKGYIKKPMSNPESLGYQLIPFLESKAGYSLEVYGIVATVETDYLIGVSVQYGKSSLVISPDDDGKSYKLSTNSLHNDFVLHKTEDCVVMTGADLVRVKICYISSYLDVQITIPYTMIVESKFNGYGCSGAHFDQTEEISMNAMTAQKLIPIKFDNQRNPVFCGWDDRSQFPNRLSALASHKGINFLPDSSLSMLTNNWYKGLLNLQNERLNEFSIGFNLGTDMLNDVKVHPYTKRMVESYAKLSLTSIQSEFFEAKQAYSQSQVSAMEKSLEHYLYHALMVILDRKRDFSKKRLSNFYSSVLEHFLKEQFPPQSSSTGESQTGQWLVSGSSVISGCDIPEYSFVVDPITGNAMKCYLGKCSVNQILPGTALKFRWVGLHSGPLSPVAVIGYTHSLGKTVFFGRTADCLIVSSEHSQLGIYVARSNDWHHEGNTLPSHPYYTITPETITNHQDILRMAKFSSSTFWNSQWNTVPQSQLLEHRLGTPTQIINGRGLNIWWLTLLEVCLSTLDTHGHPVVFCSVWICDCFDWEAWRMVFHASIE